MWSSDEGRYAEIPREMLEQGNFVSPHLNYVPYFEKPPLVYWFTAMNLWLFGQGEASARFWPSFLGALGLLTTWFFASRWFGRETGLWSTWFLLSCVGWFLVGRYLVLDMPFTFFLSLGLFCFLEGFESDNKAFLLAAYVLLGLATLIKGIIAGVFPFLIVSFYVTWTRQWRRWQKTGVLWGIPVVLAVVLPWFVMVCKKNPTFFEFFFVHEHIQRFISHEAGRPGHFYYFFMVGMLFFFPWSLFVFCIGDKLCSLKSPTTPEDRKRLFLLVWVGVIFLFFTISRSKLPPYILPVLPPLAILMGSWVKRVLGTITAGEVTGYRKLVPALFGTAFITVLVGAIVLVVYLTITKKPEKTWVEHYILFVICVFVAGSGLSFLLAKRPERCKYAFVVWGMAIILSYPAVILAMENLDPLQSTKELATALKAILKPQDTLAIYGGFEDFSDLPFYLKRRVMIVGTNVGELTYGSRIGDQREWFMSEDDFRNHIAKALREGKKVYCLAQKNEYNELLEKGIRNWDVLLQTPKAYVLVQSPSGREG